MRQRLSMILLCGALLGLLPAAQAEAAKVWKCIGFVNVDLDAIVWVHNDGGQPTDVIVTWFDAFGNVVSAGSHLLGPLNTIPFNIPPGVPGAVVVRVSSNVTPILVDAESLTISGENKRHVHCYETPPRRLRALPPPR